MVIKRILILSAFILVLTKVNAQKTIPFYNPVDFKEYITYQYQLANTTPTVPAILLPGTSFWDAPNHTFTDILENGVQMQRGAEMPKPVINLTGSLIPNGRIVYIVNAGGETPRISLADNRNTSAYKTIGMTTCDMPHGSTGYVTTNGKVHDLVTHSHIEGSDEYLDTLGLYTQTHPVTGQIVKIGTCYLAHNNHGIIDVDIQYLSANGEWNVYNYNGTHGTLIDSNSINADTAKVNILLKTNGSVIYNNTFWEDLNFAVVRSGGPAASLPNDVTINNVYYKEFTSLNNQNCGDGKEIPHDAKLTQNYNPHAHIFLKNGESAGTTGVTFTLYWELRQSTGTTNGNLTMSATSAQLTANPDKYNITGTTFTGATELGAQLSLRLSRTGGDAGDVIVTTYGIHYEIDAPGSATITSKF